MEVIEYELVKNKDLPKILQDLEEQSKFKDFLQHSWDKRKSLYSEDSTESKQQFVRFENVGDIRFTQYIGTISYKGVKINIYPACFKYKNAIYDEKLLLHNIAKWLNYSNKIDYPFLNITAECEKCDNFFDFMVSIFVNMLEKTFKQNKFFRYEKQESSVRVIKGRADFVKYYSNNIANGKIEKVPCKYYLFDFDNLVNRIIKYTCKILFQKTSNSINKQKLFDVLKLFANVSDIKVFSGDCKKINFNKTQKEYKILINLCSLFLENEDATFAEGSNEIFSFLFPTNLLFEGFISGFIKEYLADNALVSLQSSTNLFDQVSFGGKLLSTNILIRNDIIINYDSKMFVLDTKYKKISRFSDSLYSYTDITSADYYQLLTYATRHKLNKVFLIYPLNFNEALEQFPLVHKLNNLQIIVYRVPFVYDYNNSIEIDLGNIIDEIIKNNNNYLNS